MNETNGNPGNLISLRDIHKSFDRLEVIRGVDLDVRKGEVMSIVGPRRHWKAAHTLRSK